MITSLKITRLLLGADRAVMTVIGNRGMSVASTESKPERVSKNISFRPAFDSHLDQPKRPLVIVYGWLLAKSKHIHKYGDFYLGKGFDVLHVKVDPLQLMWPLNTHKLIHNIIQFVLEDHRLNQPLLIHGFSVGAYLYGETLVKMHSNADWAHSIGQRICGQIFDSPVDVHGIPRGFSRAVSPYPVLQKTLENTLSGYLKLFSDKVTSHYNRSSDAFRSNVLNTPTCFLYSKADPIGEASVIEALSHDWQKRSIMVETKKWIETPHVSHFHYHPVQYITKVNDFLVKIGLDHENKGDKERIVMVN